MNTLLFHGLWLFEIYMRCVDLKSTVLIFLYHQVTRLSITATVPLRALNRNDLRSTAPVCLLLRQYLYSLKPELINAHITA